MGETPEKKIESTDKPDGGLPDSVVDEVHAGRQDLTQIQKDQNAKDQQSTAPFGKVELFDSAADKTQAGVAVAEKNAKGGDADLAKAANANVSEASRFSLFGPSDEDRQALRDFAQKAREKVRELEAKEKADADAEPQRKANLEKLIDGIKDDKAKESMKRDMETFQHRSPAVSQAERGRFYDQVGRLIQAGDNPNVPLNADQRLKLAQEVMHKAADPTSIDQGLRGTCNVATVEARTFTRDPSAAARVIADVATTGEYKAGNVTVKPDPGSIKPDNEVQFADKLKNPRDHADQIFQVTAVNAVWQTHDLTVNVGDGSKRTFPKGTVEYRETSPDGKPISEGLYDKSKDPPELIQEGMRAVDHPHLNGDQMTDLSNMIVARDERNFVIEHSGPNQADKTFKVDSEQALKDKLKEMKQHGELPAIVMVNTDNQPFWGENISLKPGAVPAKSGPHGEHVVTITDYDETTGRVSMDNQWGKGRDHIGGSAISTGDLYIATMPSGSQETIDILKRDVEWNRANHTINTSKELELLRQQNRHDPPLLNDAEYEAQVEKTMEEARKRWEANHTPDTDVERMQAEEFYAKIDKLLHPPRMVGMQ